MEQNPSNWNVMILNDVAEIIGGGTPDSVT